MHRVIDHLYVATGGGPQYEAFVRALKGAVVALSAVSAFLGLILPADALDFALDVLLEF